MKKSIIGTAILSILLVLPYRASTQNSINNVQLPELTTRKFRKNINVPDLNGYRTLKCDFHMHTIFSDGLVWPTVRVYEAYYEGLDAISITDHIENNPSKDFVSGNDNSSYEIAKPVAQDYNIILVRGGEITRSMPPGHLNALFLSDVNKLDVSDPLASIAEAYKQGAFITWNHPGWKAQQPDTCKMYDIHKDLIKKNMIHAMEVFNENEWYPVVLGWCIDNNLAVTGYSDIHEINSHYYPLDTYHRPMTLVFAREKNSESLKEAMMQKRTVAWFGKYVAGKEVLLNELFHKSVTFKKLAEVDTKGRILIEIINNSDFIFEMKPEKEGLPPIILQPDSSDLIRIEKDKTGLSEIKYRIENWFVHAEKNLIISKTL